jgi:glycosyltransferase involved in cell wall biosynthesis
LYFIEQSRLGTFRNFVLPPQPRPIWPDDGVLRFVFCGRLVAEKNLSGLLHAWREASEGNLGMQLVVVGGGVLYEESIELARSLGLEVSTSRDACSASVIFLGMVDRPQDYIAGARAFVLPSRHEGVPTVLLLALSLGVPVLAADSIGGGVRDVLRDSARHLPDGSEDVEAGLLLPIPDDRRRTTIDAWVMALKRAMTDDEAQARWAAGARDLATVYSEEAVSTAWSNELQRLSP